MKYRCNHCQHEAELDTSLNQILCGVCGIGVFVADMENKNKAWDKFLDSLPRPSVTIYCCGCQERDAELARLREENERLSEALADIAVWTNEGQDRIRELGVEAAISMWRGCIAVANKALNVEQGWE